MKSKITLLRNNIKMKGILIILTIILGVGVSLAATYFAYAYQDSRENKLATAQLTIDYTDGETVNLNSNVPMIDDLGIENPGYEFTVKSTNSLPINLNIKLDVNENATTIDYSAVRYALYINDEFVKKDSVNKDNLIIYSYGNMSSGEILNCKLVFWVDYYYNEPEKVFSSKIKVEAFSTDSLGGVLPAISVDSDNHVENNKRFLATTIRNYELAEELGETLSENDNLILEVTGKDVKLAYRDSVGNEELEEKDKLSIPYIMNKKGNIDINLFVIPTSNEDINTNINFKLIKNGEEVYKIVEKINLVGG